MLRSGGTDTGARTGKASSAQPHPSAAWRPVYNQAVSLQAQRELGPALQLMLPLAARYPEVEDVQNLTAVLLAQHRRFAEALQAWQRVLNVRPDSVATWSNMGRACQQMGNLSQSLEYLRKAVALDPGFVDAWLNLGVTQQAMGQMEAAMQAYRQVVALQPGHAQALFNIGTMLQHQHDFEAAHAHYRQVLEIAPRFIDALANLVFTQHYLVPQEPERIAAQARSLGAQYAALHQPYRSWLVTPERDRPLRIGLVSADLRDHPVGYFLEALLQAPAAGAFIWHAYSNTHRESPLTGRIRPAFASWQQVDTWSDRALAERIREDRIDVLFDLSGFTAGHRLGMFACQPAPVQITWLGYWGSTGLPTMHAVIADPRCVPEQEAQWFSEQVWRMPHTRFCFSPPQEAPPVSPLPALRKGHLTFGCFQELAKINNAVLNVWGRIAQQLPDARWRMQSRRLHADSTDSEQLLARLKHAGIAPDRVDLHGPMSRADYLAAHGDIDIVLDVFPYPGGTTTAEALWMGVPTLTLAQPGMLGRQGQQLLSAAGLQDWVCATAQEYVAQAVYWADPAQREALVTLRQGMRELVRHSPLFDGPQFAADWVQLVRAIWHDACSHGWALAQPGPLNSR